MSGGAGPYEAILEVDHVIDTPDAQLEFQNFVLSSAEQNLVTGRVSPPKPPPQTTAPDYGFTAPQPAAPQGQPAPQQRYGFWTIEYYSMFFDVDTSDVVQRMLNTLFPKNDFIDLIANNPDLYAGSIVAYMDGKEYNYDFSLLSSAVGSIYTYVAVMPAIIWGVCRYFGCPLQLLQVIDVYGYGLTVWIPVSVSNRG
ncbi:hypothetical protein HK102_002805 [Quaeritorhiza haematococci]|nr:hypothetical protein HK102_002805 [Quaeritorhiza haematococci]